MAFTPTLEDRTRSKSDPIRNFKYLVYFNTGDATMDSEMSKVGFTSVDGLSMNTEVMAYREGGWNTNPHKLPGQTDFSPITLSNGVFSDKPGMWQMAQKMFAVQWGQGTLGLGDEFRFDMSIHVMDHPVTAGPAAGKPRGLDGAVLAFQVYNAFVASAAFGPLNASDNGVLIQTMTVHHEGFEVFYKGERA